MGQMSGSPIWVATTFRSCRPVYDEPEGATAVMFRDSCVGTHQKTYFFEQKPVSMDEAASSPKAACDLLH